MLNMAHNRCKFDHPPSMRPVLRYNSLGLPVRPGEQSMNKEFAAVSILNGLHDSNSFTAQASQIVRTTPDICAADSARLAGILITLAAARIVGEEEYFNAKN